eukprot:scaffold46_cov196-Ochromonas_danica.AAC.10
MSVLSALLSSSPSAKQRVNQFSSPRLRIELGMEKLRANTLFGNNVLSHLFRGFRRQGQEKWKEAVIDKEEDFRRMIYVWLEH